MFLVGIASYELGESITDKYLYSTTSPPSTSQVRSNGNTATTSLDMFDFADDLGTLTWTYDNVYRRSSSTSNLGYATVLIWTARVSAADNAGNTKITAYVEGR